MTALLKIGRHRRCFLVLAVLTAALSTYVEQVASFPVDSVSQWPSFPRRNVAALARDGYLRNAAKTNYKRGIATLAKNGLLPTYRSHYEETEKQDPDQDESQEKRNVASIARLQSYAAMKRNIQAMARDGYRVGRGQYNPSNSKRNIAALARNGLLIHKKDETNEDEYYYPFYQNSVPPLSEIDGPLDVNELYDYQQSVNPDMFPPMSQLFKRGFDSYFDNYIRKNPEDDTYLKRSMAGLPNQGLYRPNYFEQNPRSKRYVMTLPDIEDEGELTKNEINSDKRSVDDAVRVNFEKRHIGSLARLGLLPSFRFSGGRYSRSGRARFLWPSQEWYRKHSVDENFGIGQYIPSAKAESAFDTDDTDLSPPPVPSYSHPTGRILRRPLNNDFPNTNHILLPPIIKSNNHVEPFAKNRWQSISKETPKFYYFRSLKVPYHTSKRYLLLPDVDNILLRKGYRNSSLPSRRKNQ